MLTLDHLRVFACIVAKESFSEAAKCLHQSQPALSLQIKAIEKHYQTRLLERTGRGIRLTDTGRMFLEFARQTLDLEEHMRQRVDLVEKRGQQRVYLGAGQTMGIYTLPYLIACFQERFKEERFEFAIALADFDTNVDKLSRSLVDICILSAKPNSARFTCVPFMRDEIIAIAHANHPLAARDEVSLDDLLAHPLLWRSGGFRGSVEKRLGELGYALDRFNIAMEFNNAEAIKSCVESELGTAFVSASSVKLSLQLGRVRRLCLKDFILFREIYVAYNTGRSLSRAARLFFDFLTSGDVQKILATEAV